MYMCFAYNIQDLFSFCRRVSVNFMCSSSSSIYIEAVSTTLKIFSTLKHQQKKKHLCVHIRKRKEDRFLETYMKIRKSIRCIEKFITNG